MLKNRWSFILLSLCLSALMLYPVSAQTTLAQAGAQSGRNIGVAIEANRVGNNSYTTIARTQFNAVTPGNEMKWETTEPSQNNFNFGPGDQIVSFAQGFSAKVRGHTLVWHSQLAPWVNNITSSSTLLSVMNNHITQEMRHFQGKIWYWDVVNEAFNEDGTRRNSIFQRLLGNSYIETAFRTADPVDQNAKLCYNDFNIENMNTAKSLAAFAMVQDFKNRGVPIDCVGFQSHFVVGQVPSNLQATLQKFANLGVDVQITELDIRMPTPASAANLAQQATDYANVAKACLAVARCNDITIWGVGEPDSWIPGTFPGQGQALLYDQNYQPKAAYTSFLNALGGTSGGTNLVQNGEFDSGSANWVFNPTNGGAGSMAVVTGAGLSGTNALRVTITNGGTANWHVQVGQSGINIASGRTYTISFMAKANANRTINVFLQQNGSPFNIYRSQNFNITTTAATYTFTFNSTINDPNTALRFNVGASTVTTFIDAVSVR